jgi:putative sigma-54 modulation protein
MHINITARHFKLSQEIKNTAEKEVKRLSKYYDGIIDAEVILGWEKMDRVAEINLSVYGTVLTAQERSDSMKKAINNVVNKLERQLVKYKERLRGFHHDKMEIEQSVDVNHVSQKGSEGKA